MSARKQPSSEVGDKSQPSPPPPVPNAGVARRPPAGPSRGGNFRRFASGFERARMAGQAIADEAAKTQSPGLTSNNADPNAIKGIA